MQQQKFFGSTRISFLTVVILIAFVTVDILKSTMVEKLPNDLEGMESSMEKLYALIDEICKYVDDVVVRIFLAKFPPFSLNLDVK